MHFDFKSMPEVRRTFRKSSLIGLGSGITVAEFLLAADEADHLNHDATYFASSAQIATVAEGLDLRLGDLQSSRRLEVTVDGADQMLPGEFFVKGGGGALLKERILWSISDIVIVLGTYDKVSDRLTAAVPVEVHPAAVKLVLKYISFLEGKAELRTLQKGFPYYTESGNFIIDARFYKFDNKKLGELSDGLRRLPGVAEVGLFFQQGAVVYHPTR